MALLKQSRRVCTLLRDCLYLSRLITRRFDLKPFNDIFIVVIKDFDLSVTCYHSHYEVWDFVFIDESS